MMIELCRECTFSCQNVYNIALEQSSAHSLTQHWNLVLFPNMSGVHKAAIQQHCFQADKMCKKTVNDLPQS